MQELERAVTTAQDANLARHRTEFHLVVGIPRSEDRRGGNVAADAAQRPVPESFHGASRKIPSSHPEAAATNETFRLANHDVCGGKVGSSAQSRNILVEHGAHLGPNE